MTVPPSEPGPGAGEIAGTARWFPHLLDPINDRVLLVEKSEADYRDAAFLDDRALRPDTARHIVDWSRLEAAIPVGARRDACYIFHIGHVGSTLISRLLGEIDGVLALREPPILRILDDMLAESGQAEARWDPATLPARLSAATALLSRTFRPGQRAMVKATSFTSESAAAFVPAGARALLLHADPQAYVETILAGENSRREVRASAQARLRRLHRRCGARWNLWAMNEGERVAMAWAAEMTSLAAAQDALPNGATRRLDFQAFLDDPPAALLDLAGFFGLALDAEGAAKLARHPLMGRYSKAVEYDYSPALRAQLRAEARRAHRDTIADAMRWLDEAGRACPLVARCLEA